MKIRFIRSAAVAAMTFALAACPGGDSATGPQIELTEAQREDMFDALSAIGSAGLDEFRIAAASVRTVALARAKGAALFTLPIDETDDCPAGGTTHVSGSVTADESFLNTSADFNQTYSNCKASSDAGTLWTFNSAPNIHFKFNFTSTESGSYTGSGSMKGTLKAESTIGSGNCTIDITYNESGSESGYTYSANGTVCGQPFSESESF